MNIIIFFYELLTKKLCQCQKYISTNTLIIFIKLFKKIVEVQAIITIVLNILSYIKRTQNITDKFI